MKKIQTSAKDFPATLQTIAKATALIGGPLFLLGTVLHPVRDGQGIAAVGQIYGLTHDVQAIGLLLQAISLISMFTLGMGTFGRRGLLAWYAVLVGTLLWFGLIIFDGSHNPVMARYAPDIVHTPADLDAGGAIIVLPALILFPAGYVLLSRLLARYGMRWSGLLLGAGAVVYTIGGLLIFVLGPQSPLIQIFEVAGAVAYTLGFVLMGRAWGDIVGCEVAALRCAPGEVSRHGTNDPSKWSHSPSLPHGV